MKTLVDEIVELIAAGEKLRPLGVGGGSSSSSCSPDPNRAGNQFP